MLCLINDEYASKDIYQMTPAKKLILILFLLVVFHMALSVSMYAIATSSYLTSYHNGHGLWNYAIDSQSYHIESEILSENISRGDYRRWYFGATQWHTRLVALVYLIAPRAPFSFIPVNALAWSFAVIGVFLIANLITNGSEKYSLLIAAIYGLTPSSLALSTQLMKEPFYNLGIVVMVLGITGFLLGQKYSRNVILSISGFMLAASVRDNQLMFLILLLLTAVFLIAWKQRSTLPYILMTLSVSICFALVPATKGNVALGYKQNKKGFAPSIAKQKPVTKVKKRFAKYEMIKKNDKRIDEVKSIVRNNMGILYNEKLDSQITTWFTEDYKWYGPSKYFDDKKRILLVLQKVHRENLSNILEKYMKPWEFPAFVPARIQDLIINANMYRDSFLTYYLQPSDSTIDRDRIFRDMGSLFAYIPRAALIGLFSPFPNQWFKQRSTSGGIVGIIVVAETVVIYFLIFGFGVYLFSSKIAWSVKVWLLLFCVIMILPLGLFVPNIGTLVRLRFIYLLPVIVCGTEGLRLIIKRMIPLRLS